MGLETVPVSNGWISSLNPFHLQAMMPGKSTSIINPF